MRATKPLAQAQSHADDVIASRLLNDTRSIFSGQLPEPLTAATQQALRGGKRLRAVGAIVGAATCVGGKTADEAVANALQVKEIDSLICAIELYQAAALVHDDIADRAETRRGFKAPHVEMAAMHSQANWLGEAEHFGISAAIFLGDLLLAAADSFASACGVHTAKRFTEMAKEVAVGQYLDLQLSQLSPSDSQVAIRQALDVARLKSARYSVAHPVALGATLAGHVEFASELDHAFEPVGMAFQLRDDALSIWGDSESTGKPEGGDIAEGKRTALLAMTAAEADQNSLNRLVQLYSEESRSATEVAEVTDIFSAYGRTPHEQSIAAFTAEGQKRIGSLHLEDGPRELATEFVQALTERSR